MNDVVLEIINRLNGIVTRNHYKVCRVKVDTYAAGAERIEEVTENRCSFGACFNRKMRVDAICILCQLCASLLHNFISFMIFVCRNNTDMCCYNIGAKLFCKHHSAL